MVKSTITLRASYSAVVFFIGAIFGLSLPVLFMITGLAELLMAGLLARQIYLSEEIMPRSLFGLLVIQYAEGYKIDPVIMIHMAGSRILACALGIFAVWWYIPTILLYLLTCIDLKKKGRR